MHTWEETRHHPERKVSYERLVEVIKMLCDIEPHYSLDNEKRMQARAILAEIEKGA